MMSRDRRIPRVAVVAAVAATLLWTLEACSPPSESGSEPEPDPLYVGVLVPASGSLAVWGVNSERGIRLAADRINADGGIGRPVQLLVEDSECEPEKAVSVLEGWISRGDVPVVLGAACSSDVLAMAPIAERSEIVVLSTGASNPEISEAGEFVFRNWPSDRIQGALTADHASESGYRKAAILFVDNAYGQGLEQVFRERFAELGGAVVASRAYPQGDTDFHAEIADLAGAGADVLYLPAYTEEYPTILAQAQELEVPILAAETFDDPETIASAGEAADGAVFPSPGSIDRSTPEGEDFAAAFEGRYGEPAGITSDTGFDAMNLVAEALAGGARTGPEIRDFLNRVEGYRGAAGTIEFDAAGDAGKEIAFYSVSGGVAERLE